VRSWVSLPRLGGSIRFACDNKRSWVATRHQNAETGFAVGDPGRPPGVGTERVLGVRRVMTMVMLFGQCLLIGQWHGVVGNRHGGIGKSGGQHVEKAVALDC
jgi:hypothetical protein